MHLRSCTTHVSPTSIRLHFTIAANLVPEIGKPIAETVYTFVLHKVRRELLELWLFDRVNEKGPLTWLALSLIQFVRKSYGSWTLETQF